jgi:hypothetical protein
LEKLWKDSIIGHLPNDLVGEAVKGVDLRLEHIRQSYLFQMLAELLASQFVEHQDPYRARWSSLVLNQVLDTISQCDALA